MAPSARELLKESDGKDVPVSFWAGTLPTPFDNYCQGTLFQTTDGDPRLSVIVPGKSVVGQRNFPVTSILDRDIFTPRKPRKT